MVSKPLNLVLSLLLLLLSVALVTFSLELSEQMRGQLDKNIKPIDMVVGAKGSPLQLVLSSVLHIDNPTGNILLKDTKVLENHPFVETTIPLSYGDNYKGYKILGTTSAYLENYDAELAEGKLNKKSLEVVVGSTIANRLNLKVGDTFVGSHGLAANSIETHDHDPHTVVGILKPTGSVVDQLLITNLQSIWDAHDHEGDAEEKEGHEHDDNHEHEERDDHEHENHDHNHDDDHKHEHEHDHKHEEGGDHDHEGHDEDEEDKQITSLLVKFKNPLGSVQLPRFINENTNMQAALPYFEVQRLTGLLGSGVKTINGIAIAIFFVSGLSIFISLLKTIRERKSELALLRTYGLRTAQLLSLALLEGCLLAVLGFVLGWLLGRIGIWSVSGYMIESYGYELQVTGPQIFEIMLLGLIFVLAIVATLLASVSIFKLNVAKTLSDA